MNLKPGSQENGRVSTAVCIATHLWSPYWMLVLTAALPVTSRGGPAWPHASSSPTLVSYFTISSGISVSSSQSQLGFAILREKHSILEQ